jgi:hypothetical protein
MHRAGAVQWQAQPRQRLRPARARREQVSFEAVVGHAEDRRLGILVDRHDHLGVLHAGQVLDGAADAAGHVQLRGDDLARLAHLPVVGCVTRVHGRPAGAERGAQLVGQRVSTSLNFSLLPIARPPETMILAAVSSGGRSW